MDIINKLIIAQRQQSMQYQRPPQEGSVSPVPYIVITFLSKKI